MESIDLTGTWRNQLNSYMTIESITDDVISGIYYTAVESKEGAARLASKISGIVKTTENGKILGFNVLWNKGKSISTWVGQCNVCDGQEKIFTSWILRSYEEVSKRWMNTRINQDTFTRAESRDEDGNEVIESSIIDAEPFLEIRGKWESTSGDSFDVTEVLDQGTFKGSHDGEIIAGRVDSTEKFTALGFVAASSNKIRGWSGHIDNLSSSNVLETSWLEHTYEQSCNNPRKLVNFGMDSYSKSFLTGQEISN